MSAPEHPLRTFRVKVAYAGTAFHGWQRQDGQRTVQGVLEDALLKLTGTSVVVRAAGRTDAGVHARGQVASFTAPTSIPLEKVPIALTSVLPDDVAVVDADEMPEGFDAKRLSVGKRYVYRILPRRLRDPFRVATHWQVKGRVEIVRMQQAARHLVGENDYESFRSKGCVAAHAIRYLWRVEVDARDDEIHVEVRGNAFCQHMVRIIAGTLVDVGQFRFLPLDVEAMLRARRRESAGQTAPAHGLTLEEVYYPDALDHARIPDSAIFPGFPVAAEHRALSTALACGVTGERKERTPSS